MRDLVTFSLAAIFPLEFRRTDGDDDQYCSVIHKRPSPCCVEPTYDTVQNAIRRD
jgi:hypothetical protein